MEFDIDKIEQYINGQLSGKELSTFEKQLQENDLLAKEVAIQKTLIKGIQKKGIDADRDFLASIHQEAKSKGLLDQKPINIESKPIKNEIAMDKKTSIFSIGRILSIAAAVLLAVVAFNYFSADKTITNSPTLAYGKETRTEMTQEIKATLGENFGFADGDEEETIKKKQVDSLLNSAWVYISDGSDYERAIPIFERVLTIAKDEKRAIHGLAEGYFQQGDYKKALETMKDLVQDGTYDWINDVRFRYAQCSQMLNIGDKNTIITWYKMIINDANAPSELKELSNKYLAFLK